jgi:hypothetical protein
LGNGIDENCDGKDDPILGLVTASELVIAYPNPSNGEFELKNVDMSTVNIYTIDNKTVKFKLNKQTIKIENPDGIYLITGKNSIDKKPFALKIVIQDRKF